MEKFYIEGRLINESKEPYIIAEAGINHNGSFEKAKLLVDKAKECGADCVKFQYHIAESELIKSDIKPGYISKESLWDITKRIELTKDENFKIKKYCEEKKITYLCTPFSKDAAVHLNDIGVNAFKIGSGESSNLPLLAFISKFQKPMILSTGMSNIEDIQASVKVISDNKCPLMLLHCTSVYPTPYELVRLNSINELKNKFGLEVGFSDHTTTNYASFASIPLGATLIERHFTVSKDWPGPDIYFSLNPDELKDLVQGTKAIFKSMIGNKSFLEEEKPVKDFAFSSVCSIKDIEIGEVFCENNIWVKKPGTGKIPANQYYKIIGKKAKKFIPVNTQLDYDQIG